MIFFAILMHKIPTAVGLGTFLNKAGLPINKVFMHVLAFTGTSPVANLITFIILSNLGLTESSDFLSFYVGVLLLVSSGTFLYVSTIHILPDVFGGDKASEDDDDDFKSKSPNRTTDLCFLLLGLFTPVLLSSLHEH